MHLIDYTHPGKVPPLYLPHDRRSSAYYLRLDELPPEHPFAYPDWCLFRYEEWLEGGSAWVQAKDIAEDLERYIEIYGLEGEVRPVVGSADHGFDEGLAQGLITFGYSPLVAEVSVASALEDEPLQSA